MEGYFTYYPELKWTILFPAKGYRDSDKLKTSTDASYSMDFRLGRWEDLRNLPDYEHSKLGRLKLIGTNEIIILINGPDSRLNEVAERLPKYKGKSWAEINYMRLERDFLNCKNFKTSVCNSQLLGMAEFKLVILGSEANELDYTKADEICAKCKHFESK